jgi:hypothetical protein
MGGAMVVVVVVVVVVIAVSSRQFVMAGDVGKVGSVVPHIASSGPGRLPSGREQLGSSELAGQFKPPTTTSSFG